MANPRKPGRPQDAPLPYALPSPYPDITPALVAMLRPLVKKLVEETLMQFVAEGKIVAADPDSLEDFSDLDARWGLHPVRQWNSAPRAAPVAPSAPPAAPGKPPRKGPGARR